MAFFLAAIFIHLLLVIRVVPQSSWTSWRTHIKEESRGSTEPRLDGLSKKRRSNYFFFFAAFFAAGFFAAFFLAAIYLPPSLRNTDLGDEISETMPVISKWFAHSHRSVASVAATTSGIAITSCFDT
jgi:hypothetical protein